MLKVYVKCSAIYLYPYTRGTLPYIEKGLSVYDVFAKRFTQFMYNYDREEGENYGVLKIPKGYGIEQVETAINDAGLPYQIIDRSDMYPEPKPIKVKMKINPRNDIQKEAIEFLDAHAKDHQSFLVLDVGMGKTYCTVKHIANQQKATMIVSYNLGPQWVERIQSYTNLEVGSDIITIVGTKYIEDIIHGREKPNASIYIVTTNTLVKLAETYGYDELQKLAEVLHIGIKVFDEAHTKYKMFNTIDLNMQVDETIYLTATPGRSINNEDKMYNRIYNNVASYGSWTAKLNNYYIINYITYDSHSSTEERLSCKTPRGLSSIKYSRYLLDKYFESIMQIIVKYSKPIMTENPSGRLLIVTDWLQDIQKMKEWFENNYPEYSVGTYCNIVKDKVEKEKQLTKRIVIGTIGSMQNGKDLPNLQIIFPISQWSSQIVTRQLLGRLRPLSGGKNVFFYDMADRSFPDVMRERKERDVVYQSRAANSIREDLIDLDHV